MHHWIKHCARHLIRVPIPLHSIIAPSREVCEQIVGLKPNQHRFILNHSDLARTVQYCQQWIWVTGHSDTIDPNDPRTHRMNVDPFFDLASSHTPYTQVPVLKSGNDAVLQSRSRQTENGAKLFDGWWKFELERTLGNRQRTYWELTVNVLHKE